MTVRLDPSDFTLASARNGAGAYARAARATALPKTPQKTRSRVVSTSVGLNLGPLEISYTSDRMTFDLADMVRSAMQQGKGFAEELELARAQNAAPGPADPGQAVVTPGRAARAYEAVAGMTAAAQGALIDIA